MVFRCVVYPFSVRKLDKVFVSKSQHSVDQCNDRGQHMLCAQEHFCQQWVETVMDEERTSLQQPQPTIIDPIWDFSSCSRFSLFLFFAARLCDNFFALSVRGVVNWFSSLDKIVFVFNEASTVLNNEEKCALKRAKQRCFRVMILPRVNRYQYVQNWNGRYTICVYSMCVSSNFLVVVLLLHFI